MRGAMVRGTSSRVAVVALGASLIINAVFLASFLARDPAAPASELLLARSGEPDGETSRLMGAPSTAAGHASGTTTQLADMYTAPLHLMKGLIDNALKGVNFDGKPLERVKRQKTEPAADPAKASMNTELNDNKVLHSTGAFFDQTLKAFVNPLLLPDLAQMNTLQSRVFAHKLAVLKAADPQIAHPTSGGKPVSLNDASNQAIYQWGTENPVNKVMRLDCTDSVMDSSANGAPLNRLWGSQHADDHAGAVDACGPGDACKDPCAYSICNKGHKYTVECPPGCAARTGPVFGGGTLSNPFMDASSVCGAALAAGLARNDAPSILTLTIVEPVASYTGTTFPPPAHGVAPAHGASAAHVQGLAAREEPGSRTTLDYTWHDRARAQETEDEAAVSQLDASEAASRFRQKWGGASWFGVRAFTLQNLVAMPVPRGPGAAEHSRAAPSGSSPSPGAQVLATNVRSASVTGLHASPDARTEGGRGGAGARGSKTVKGSKTFKGMDHWHMGAPYAPRGWDRAHVFKLPADPPTMEEIEAAGGPAAWAREHGVRAREEKKAAEGGLSLSEEGGLLHTALVDLPLAQSASHMAFAGKEGGVAVAAGAALVFNDGIWDAITVECWVKDLAIGAHSGYVSAFNSDAAFGAKHFGFFLGTYKHQFAFGVGAGDSGDMDYVLAPDWLSKPNEGKWTHLAGTYETDSGLKLYVNGLFVGCAKAVSGPIEFPTQGAPVGSVDVVMGGVVAGLTDPITGAVGAAGSSMTGALDEVRIWSVARGQEDIYNSMHRTLGDEWRAVGGALPEGLELYWRFDFDAVSQGGCNPDYAWLPCAYTCDEVQQLKAHLLAHKDGVDLVPSDSPVETLTLARGCMQCPPHPDVDYASWTPTGNVRIGDHVDITCYDGFRTQLLPGGSASPECLTSMDYTPGVECIAECPALAAPAHGSLAPAGKVDMFTWVVLSCDEGYDLVGNPVVMCRPDHSYLFDHGTCVATCPAYPAVRYGSVSQHSRGHLRAGETAHIECNAGYVLAYDSAPVATCGEGGEYDVPAAECVPLCGAHPAVANADVSTLGPTVLGDEVQISCHEGYELAQPEMQTVVCQDNHAYSQPWLRTGPGVHTGAWSRCVAICPPYPYVDFSTVTVDGSWEKADDPVREGSVVQVTCDTGYHLGQYSGGTPTARCVDSGSGKGGVYDPPVCSPPGGLNPKPLAGHSTCSPAQCIETPGLVPVVDRAEPPPTTPEDQTEEERVGDPASGWGLNIRCGDYRDKAFTWGKEKQLDFLSKCMSQDCEQSLEGQNVNKAHEVGCRYTDTNGFCYHAGATQMWCAEHTEDARCHDGGETWALHPLGAMKAHTQTLGARTQMLAAGTARTAWMPVANYPLRGGAKVAFPDETVSCTCMKNCACTLSWNSAKCYCSDQAEAPVGSGPWQPDKIIASNKDGQCFCNCVAGPAVTVLPVEVEEPEQAGAGVEVGGGGGGGGGPFQRSDRDSTGKTKIGNRKTHFLDRQTVDCGTNAINKFRLQTPGTNINYVFRCAENGRLESPQEKVTDWEDDGGGNIIFLDRLNVRCGDDSLITKFHYARNNKHDKGRYEYSCAKSIAPLSCRNDKTEENDDGGGGAKVQFLDRHNVRCNADEAMQKFHLRRKTDKIFYKYRCCKAVLTEVADRPDISRGGGGGGGMRGGGGNLELPIPKIGGGGKFVSVKPPEINLPPPPPPQDETIQDAVGASLCTKDTAYPNECKSLLNIRCADWRDKADYWSPSKQVKFYASCMSQDCEQSLEGGNTNKPEQPGCRFLDANGFCFAYGSAQMWCAGRGLGSAWCNDGGDNWGLQSNGLGTAPANPTGWTPHGDVAYRGQFSSKPHYACSCMKDCTCSKTNKCWCADAAQTETGPGSYYGDATIFQNAAKKGFCACTCDGVSNN